MIISRRHALASLGAGLALGTAACGRNQAGTSSSPGQSAASTSLKTSGGDVDWRAVRTLFPLRSDIVNFATFLLVSHPKPVAAAIESFRAKLDADPVWLEEGSVAESEGLPFHSVKVALAEYAGGKPEEICLTSNTTQALAMAYHGLKIRGDQEVVTTEHDHYSHHESIRYAAARSGCGVRFVKLYDEPADASAVEMVARIELAISPRTRAVGVTWVHSSSGVKLPIAAIADAVARANRGRAAADRCLLIVDGVHGFANQDVDVAKLGCDFFATGTHKWLFAPRGTGFLWGRSDVWNELRPTIPSFDPEYFQPWEAWMNRTPLPPTQAAFVSPGGFLAYEHLLAVPAAVALHREIGRAKIAARITELNNAFREGMAKMPGVTLHTPRDPEISGGLSCFDIAGRSAANVATELYARKIRTNSSPYKVSCARVAAGIVNFPEEIDSVLREIRALTKAS